MVAIQRADFLPYKKLLRRGKGGLHPRRHKERVEALPFGKARLEWVPGFPDEP